MVAVWHVGCVLSTHINRAEIIVDISSPQKANFFEVDLQNDWERRYLAQHLGVTEQALTEAASGQRGASLESLCKQLFQ